MREVLGSIPSRREGGRKRGREPALPGEAQPGTQRAHVGTRCSHTCLGVQPVTCTGFPRYSFKNHLERVIQGGGHLCHHLF